VGTARLASSVQGFQHHFGGLIDQGQQGRCRAAGGAAALFPVLNTLSDMGMNNHITKWY